MTYYYVWFAFFAILAYFIATDNSIATFVVLLSKIARVQYEKAKWWVLHNPGNPVVKYMMWRRAMKMAKELEKEFNLNSKNN
jgi:hypothetical protein